MLRPGSDTYNNRSSAYKATLCSLPQREIPFIVAEDFNMIDRGSIANANKSGLKGHPCRVPLDNAKKFERLPFVTTDALGEEYKSLIQAMKVGPKPNACRHLNKYAHSTLSKAFSASREITTSGTSPDAGEYMTLKSCRMLVFKA